MPLPLLLKDYDRDYEIDSMLNMTRVYLDNYDSTQKWDYVLAALRCLEKAKILNNNRKDDFNVSQSQAD